MTEDKDQDKTVFQGCGVLVNEIRAVELPAGCVVRLAGQPLHFATERLHVLQEISPCSAREITQDSVTSTISQ